VPARRSQGVARKAAAWPRHAALLRHAAGLCRDMTRRPSPRARKAPAARRAPLCRDMTRLRRPSPRSSPRACKAAALPRGSQGRGAATHGHVHVPTTINIRMVRRTITNSCFSRQCFSRILFTMFCKLYK